MVSDANNQPMIQEKCYAMNKNVSLHIGMH